ncbi:NADH-quinone oxidoreductase subunit A [Phnomibacter ginsenosidimutans]|uniref:NADH-quinone oxidoreductase subunit A n=1 Tax=Phnomibacter ginsenosidimutans TaxID=2676868 RepID=UPI0024838BB2|nr:NADH-quinone oxidoreductase subunit A [Phnomibacter ginsenosidimutans]
MYSLAEVVGSPSQYLPIGIQLLFAIGFIAVMIAVSHYLGPRRNTSDKLDNFESGIEQVGNARQPMAVKVFSGSYPVCVVRCGSDFFLSLCCQF